MKKGWYWPWIIVTLLVATVAGQGVMLYAATHDPTMAIEEDYYRKAVAWDEQMARDSVSRLLGWSARAAVSSPDSAGAEVTIRLAESAGAPVRGARVRVTAVHNLEAARTVEHALSEREDGTYTARLPLHRSGLWELRVTAVRGTDRFSTSLRAEAAPAASKVPAAK